MGLLLHGFWGSNSGCYSCAAGLHLLSHLSCPVRIGILISRVKWCVWTRAEQMTWGTFYSKEKQMQEDVEVAQLLRELTLTLWTWGLELRSQPHHPAGVPHKPVTPAPTGPETGVSLGLTDCQPGWENSNPKFPERPYLKGIDGKWWGGTHCPLPVTTSTQGCTWHTYTHILKYFD